jgi:hypothetical protein
MVVLMRHFSLHETQGMKQQAISLVEAAMGMAIRMG